MRPAIGTVLAYTKSENDLPAPANIQLPYGHKNSTPGEGIRGQGRGWYLFFRTRASLSSYYDKGIQVTLMRFVAVSSWAWKQLFALAAGYILGATAFLRLLSYL